MLHGVTKILKTMKDFTKRSGRGLGSYESLHCDVSIIGKELKMEHGKASCRSKLGCLPDDSPKGYLPVYVGIQRIRFVIRTKDLSHQLFKELLKRSEEVFGYEYEGGLTIACEPAFFEHVLWFLGTNSPAAATTQLQELLDHFYEI